LKNGVCLGSCGVVANNNGWYKGQCSQNAWGGNGAPSYDCNYCCEVPEPKKALKSGAKGVLRSVQFGKYCAAENDSKHHVHCNRDDPGSWETYSFVKVGGSGNIQSGDTVAIYSEAWDKYCAAVDTDGRALNCDRDSIGAWEKFVITRSSGSGTIYAGDSVSLRSGHWNTYCKAASSGKYRVRCGSGSSGGAARFQLVQ